MNIKRNLDDKKITAGRFSLMPLLLSFLVSASFAHTETKTFELGTGTANPTSAARTFAIPCGVPVKASVKLSRNGEAGKENDIPITLDLRKPGATADEEGSVADTDNVTVTRQISTFALSGSSSSRGCSLHWKVRVRSSSGTPRFAITGSITMEFANGTSPTINVSYGDLRVNKKSSATLKIGTTSGLQQGDIWIFANWQHGLGPIPGPLPVKLKFELIDPDGTVVDSDSGYSDNEVNPCCSGNKMRLIFKITTCVSGQWKIRITNNSDEDAMAFKNLSTVTAFCGSYQS